MSLSKAIVPSSTTIASSETLAVSFSDLPLNVFALIFENLDDMHLLVGEWAILARALMTDSTVHLVSMVREMFMKTRFDDLVVNVILHMIPVSTRLHVYDIRSPAETIVPLCVLKLLSVEEFVEQFHKRYQESRYLAKVMQTHMATNDQREDICQPAYDLLMRCINNGASVDELCAGELLQNYIGVSSEVEVVEDDDVETEEDPETDGTEEEEGVDEGGVDFIWA